MPSWTPAACVVRHDRTPGHRRGAVASVTELNARPRTSSTAGRTSGHSFIWTKPAGEVLNKANYPPGIRFIAWDVTGCRRLDASLTGHIATTSRVAFSSDGLSVVSLLDFR